MSDLTSELNLKTAVDDDDTADYLTLDLKDSLQILDGLFNAATGHAHNGAHQGGVLQFQDLTIGEDLVVNGTLLVKQTATFQGALNAQAGATVTGNLGTGTLGTTGLATLASLDVIGTSRLRGAVTIDGTLNAGGTLTVTNLNVTASTTLVSLTTQGITVNGNGVISGSLTVGGSPVWTNATAPVDVNPSANTIVKRNANGYIQASYISYTADVQGGKPTYVLGHNGDNYMRWWPASAIGPPGNVDAASYYVETAINGSWATTDGNPGVTWSLSLPIAGHWIVSIEAYIAATAIGGGANGYVDVVATGPVADSPTQYFRWGSTDQQVRGGYGKSAHGVYGAGTVQTWRIPSTWRTANGSVTGKIVAHFVPSQAYPG